MIASSYSRMKWSACPFAFNAQFIARTHKEPENEAMLRGSAVHEAVADYMQHCLKHGLASDPDWIENYHGPPEVQECMDRLAETPFALSPIGADWVCVEAKMAFDKHLSPIIMLDQMTAWMSRDVAFRLVVDLSYVMRDTLYIVDWKTGFGAEMDETQTRIYGWLVYQYYLAVQKGLKRDVDQIAHVNTSIVNLTIGKYSTDTWPVMDGQSIEAVILDHLDTVNSWTEYPAIPCNSCKWCTVPDCPVRGEAETALVSTAEHGITIPSEIQTRDEAEKAVLFLLFAESVTEQVQQLLRGYVETNGPVAAGGKIAELRESTPWKCTDFEKLCRMLMAYGVESKLIWEHSSMSEATLEKLAKKAGIKDRMAMLLTAGERKQYKPKFGLYNDSLLT